MGLEGGGEGNRGGLMMKSELDLENKLKLMAVGGVSHSVKEFGNTYAY